MKFQLVRVMELVSIREPMTFGDDEGGYYVEIEELSLL